MKRLLSVFLLIIMAFSVVGCENVEYIESSQEESREESQNIYEQLESDLPDLEPDENGEIIERSFVIATDDKRVFYNEESTATSVSRAVEERTTFLKDKYGANILVKQVTTKNLTNELKAALESGVDYCDLIAVSAKETVKLQTAGLLGDMNKLPDFDPNAKYFNQNIAKSLAANDKLYMLPDASAQIYDETYVMFFNRDLVNTQGGQDPETLVMQGKWTWDSFHEVAKAAAPKVYNKSTSDIATDVFGFSSYESESSFPLAMWNSCGIHIIDNNYYGSVDISYTADELLGYAEKLKSRYNSRGRLPLEGSSASLAFKEGRLAFFCNKLEFFYSLRDGNNNGNNFGMVPMPKYDENQTSYCSPVSTEARVYSIPKNIENQTESHKAFVSAVIKATCASGSETIKKAYLNQIIAAYLNNNKETVMFQTVLNTVYFDFATVYSSNISVIRRATVGAVSDYIEYGSGLKNSMASARPNFNNYVAENFS